MCVIVHLEPAEVRQDQSRVVGGDTGPSVAHTNNIFDTLADKKNMVWAYLWFFGGSDGVLRDCRFVITPIDPAKVGQDQSRVVGEDTGPSVAYASSSIAYWVM